MDSSIIKNFFGNQRANTGKYNVRNKQTKSNKEVVEILLSLIIKDRLFICTHLYSST
ncbi:Uncharacterised protein [Legionella feeleii]|uniref:Uncharacterized protein n=1 Tax=Legionella feeleii TaxID=453 RepID=A0A378KNK1_9GAMM|nr:Uncharacterised protein [Legionella feeleii]